MGMGRWPTYAPPPALVFSAPEATLITKWSQESPELFKKLQVHNNQWAAIVNTHNKEAIKVNLTQLEKLGHDQDVRDDYKKRELEKCHIKE